MSTIHRVKQGEHLSGIALQYRFPDYRIIWNRPENAELKAKRLNPNVLFPGDEVFIPDKKIKEEIRSTDEKHTFQTLNTPLSLKLELLREYDDPIANTNCELIVGADVFELTSDGRGIIEQQISKKAHSAILRISDKVEINHTEIPFNRVIAIRIGDLDPVKEISGQVVRLANLGYYRGLLDKLDTDEFKSAVEEFQCEHGLIKDGICGPQTQAMLEQVHGC